MTVTRRPPHSPVSALVRRCHNPPARVSEAAAARESTVAVGVAVTRPARRLCSGKPTRTVPSAYRDERR